MRIIFSTFLISVCFVYSVAATAETAGPVMGVMVSTGVLPAPSPTPLTGVIVSTGVLPAPTPSPTTFPGVVVHPIGVTPILGVVVEPPLTEEPVMSADLFASDEQADNPTTSSEGSLTMYAEGDRVTSFLLKREVRPVCPPGEMCPMFILLQQTKFRVIQTMQEDCGSTTYSAVAEPASPAAPGSLSTTAGAATQRLTVTDYHESDCRDGDIDWKVVVTQGYTKSIYYGEPTPVDSNSP